ncbi:hypothetical protein F2Q69_00034454 [Brassica cretica]|uniref:Uncharacterized protein n=1 Tax=Brassica cretica TaxID=69181 RepID=A0A8S9SKJ5_BRACR|nr:hypothetical protein F2Q69_00034454 [Brassica cretica]
MRMHCPLLSIPRVAKLFSYRIRLTVKKSRSIGLPPAKLVHHFTNVVHFPQSAQPLREVSMRIAAMAASLWADMAMESWFASEKE